jgi:hypothetical protein
MQIARDMRWGALFFCGLCPGVHGIHHAFTTTEPRVFNYQPLAFLDYPFDDFSAATEFRFDRDELVNRNESANAESHESPKSSHTAIALRQ